MQRRLAAQANPAPRGCSELWRAAHLVRQQADFRLRRAGHARTFGVVDYCRIGCDVSLDGDDVWYMRLFHRERVSTKQSIGNTVFRRQLNGRAYGSDPDVFFLREENCKLTPQQKDQLATVNALFSGIC